MGDALDDADALLNARFGNRHRLEAAFQGAVLFDVLPVFREGGGADDLDLPPGEGRLQDVGGVHAALRIPRADDTVHFIDKEDDVSLLLDLVDQALHPALKLPAELGACHQGCEVQSPDLFILELVGHLSVRDLLGQAFRDGRLAHAGLADQAGVVLLPAVQNLDHSLQLGFPAHDPVQLSVPGAAGEILAIILQEFSFLTPGLLRRLRSRGFPPGTVLRAGGIGSEEFVEKGESGGFPVFVVSPVRIGNMINAAEGFRHLLADPVQILIGNPHFLHQVLHGPDIQFLCAFQAKAFVHGLAVLHLGNENYGDVLFASCANRRLHLSTFLSEYGKGRSPSRV